MTRVLKPGVVGRIANAFCPTGAGGGRDNSCGGEGGKSGSGASRGLPPSLVKEIDREAKILAAENIDEDADGILIDEAEEIAFENFEPEIRKHVAEKRGLSFEGGWDDEWPADADAEVQKLTEKSAKLLMKRANEETKKLQDSAKLFIQPSSDSQLQDRLARALAKKRGTS